MISVLIVDDHTLIRFGIKALLEKVPDIRIIGEADDGYEALRLIKELQPDVVLMDISIPGLNGLEVTIKAKRAFPKVRVIILSMHTSEEYVMQALKSGVVGYVVKDATTIEVELAIRSAMKGGTFISPMVSSKIVKDYVGRLSNSVVEKEHEGPFYALTSRQREILQLIAEGYSTKEIAKKLSLSINTVDVHRANIMERLDIHDLAGLVRYAINTGLIDSKR